MRDHFAAFGDAAVALVTFTRQRNLRGYRRRLDLPDPIDELLEAVRAA